MSEMGEVVVIKNEEPEQQPAAPIRIYPDPILQEIMPEAKPGPDMLELFEKMIYSMKTYGGIGIAAPQIGVRTRAIVVKDGDKTHCILNPRITYRGGIKVPSAESCLSVPGVTRTARRSDKVVVVGTDALGQSVKVLARARVAACFQHEIDHLDGVTLADL